MRFAITLMLIPLAACGGGTSGPTPVAVPTATPTPAPTPTPTPTPTPATSIRDSIAGALSAGNEGCSSPGSIHDSKPCKRYGFTVTREGPFSAELNWSPRDTDLDLELWRGSQRLIRTLDVTHPENMSSTVTPGDYEVRVVYYQGTATTFYTLVMVRPL
jgi:hypothetical protein